MDKEQALHGFWSSFGLETYDENTVPEDAMYPRLTYGISVSDLDAPVSLTASLWYHSVSWTGITSKCDEISTTIGLGGILVPYDDGAIWIKRGTPFAQRMSDPDDSIRRIVLMIEAEFLDA